MARGGCALAAALAMLGTVRGQACDSTQFGAVAMVVNDLCCTAEGGCSGVPTSCNTNCAPTCVQTHACCPLADAVTEWCAT